MTTRPWGSTSEPIRAPPWPCFVCGLQRGARSRRLLPMESAAGPIADREVHPPVRPERMIAVLRQAFDRGDLPGTHGGHRCLGTTLAPRWYRSIFLRV